MYICHVVWTYLNLFLSGKYLKTYYGENSFKNFILYVIKQIETDKNKLKLHVDVHFRPLYLLGAYCDIDYTFIGRIETFEKDVRYY